MIPRPAQYLIRFDDLCPTISHTHWDQFHDLVERFGVRPILAVVPDNRDTELERAPYDPRFWDEMRAMEEAGAVIAVHGYQHLCSSRGESLLGLHRHTEFAGVDLETQRNWVRTGFQILRERGLNPRLWVGPRHGFDRNTLRALRAEGVKYISDGFARAPFLRYGLTWIPQQLWAPVAKSKGLWTICIHPYTAGTSTVEGLRWFLEDHSSQFTSFDRVLSEFDGDGLSPKERIYERLALWRVQQRQNRRRRRWRRR